MTLRRVDLREREGRERRRRARTRRRRRGADRADPVGGVRQVQASLDDARQEVTRTAEETAGALLGRLVAGQAAEKKLVHELGAGQNARPNDARPLGAGDQRFAVQPFELDTVHHVLMGHRGRRCKSLRRSEGGAGGRGVPCDLGLEVVERPELLLFAQARHEVHAQAGAVEVAGEVEQERLDRETPLPRPWAASRCSSRRARAR